MKSFEASFRNSNFSPSTSVLLNYFFPFIDIAYFFPSLKLQYCRTVVLLHIFKSDDGHAISRQEKRRLPKSTARFPAKKSWRSPAPVVLSWDSPPPPPESVRADVRAYADVTTKISRIDGLPTGGSRAGKGWAMKRAVRSSSDV